MVIFNKLPTYYAVGTATVDAGETTVTGTGTVWSSLQPGDLFGVHIGLAVPIATVVSDTEFTLLFPWPGAAQTDADYCVQFIPRSVGVQEATRQLLLMLANGNLDAFAALEGLADRLPMFTGPGTLTLVGKADLTNGLNFDKQVADLAARAAYDNSPMDFVVLVNDVGDGRAAVYSKLSNASADWSTPGYITGPKGADGVNPRGFYDNATAYAVDDLVYSGGSTWIAKIPTTGNAPPTLPTTENTQWRLFARAGAALNPRGDYDNATAYEPLDAVLSGGSTWIAKIPTTGNAPPTLPTTSNAQWQLMAQKGADGTGTGDFVGPDGGVNTGDIVAFLDTTGKAGRAATQDEIKAAIGGLPIRGYISPGFNLANNATDAVNDIDFPTGIIASDVVNPILMTHTAGTAQLDVAYGTGNGGRFDSAISDGWWHCFIIGDGELVSRGFSKSLDPTTQPNYPAGFTHYRRVASWLRVSSSLIAMTQYEDDFEFESTNTERNSTAAQASTLLTIRTPLGIITKPKLAITSQMGGSNGNIQTQLASAGKPTSSYTVMAIANDIKSSNIDGNITTNTSSQIQFAVVVFSGSLSLNVLISKGYIDKRGKV